MISKIKQFLHRPYPTNLEALKHAKVSYSSYGEDLIASSIVGYFKTDGVYLDIGCFDPINKSNTYIFYQRGWRGVCVDPNPIIGKRWKKFRPEDLFLNVGVSNEEGTSKYSFDQQRQESSGFFESSKNGVIEVKTMTVTTILNKYFNNRKIDLLSIDCEGLDFDIIRQFPFEKNAPTLILIEDFGPVGDSEIETFLTSKGYKLRAKAVITKIFELS